jgi:hypothetical protein
MRSTSETSATRRLFQCADSGCYRNDISSKFEGDGVADLSDEEFMARRAIIRQVKDWMESMQGKPSEDIHKIEWVPILYQYEVLAYFFVLSMHLNVICYPDCSWIGCTRGQHSAILLILRCLISQIA